MKKKILILIPLLLLLTLASLIGIILCIKTQKSDNTITVAFYNTSESIQLALTTLTQEYADKNEKTVVFYNVDSQSDLTEQLQKQKVDLIFAPDGYAVNKAVAAAAEGSGFSDINLSALFTTMITSSKVRDKKYSAIPLVFDNFEIDIDLSAFKMSGMESIATWKHIEEFSQIQKGKIDYPVSFAGAEPVFLLDFIGAMGEAMEGKEAYDKAAEILIQASHSSDFDAAELAKKLFINADAPIPYTLYYLQQYVKKGYITPASQYLTHKDINSYIQQRVTNLFVTSLSIHRTYDVKAISRFSSIYFPSDKRPEGRHFTANTTFAVPVTKKSENQALVQELISVADQTYLSQTTGLAPVLANCPTPDKQADDARFWIAATSTPLAGLGHEADFTPDQLEALRKEICKLIF